MLETEDRTSIQRHFHDAHAARLAENDVAVAGPRFDYEGGRILELDFTETRADLMIEWHNYSLRTERFAMYVIEGEHVTWQPGELRAPEAD